MRICLVHQYFKTPKTGGAIRSYYIARHLANEGHEVIVVTARNNEAYSIEQIDGYEVHYLPVYYENHLGFLSRIHAFFLFVWKANRLMKSLGQIDLNYVITTPLTTGLIALKSKGRYNTPYIFEVGDLWPEAPIQLGILKNYFLKRLAFYFEHKCYRNAKHIIALSPDIKAYISKIIAPDKISVITNFADRSIFKLSSKVNINEAKEPPTKDFVIAYLGTLGVANHLEYLLNIAQASSSLPIKFIIAGGGAQFDRIKQLADQVKLHNIAFYRHRSKEQLQELVNLADAIYISFKDVPILSTGSPNKFFDGLAAGKLIITNFKGWIYDLINHHHCGFYHHPDDQESFIQQIMPYINDPKLLIKAQKQSYALSEQFTPTTQLAKLESIIND